MSKLQELLDQKFPLEGLNNKDKHFQNSYRTAFADGYNAAIQEMRGNVLRQEESEERQAIAYLNSRKPIDDTKF